MKQTLINVLTLEEAPLQQSYQPQLPAPTLYDTDAFHQLHAHLAREVYRLVLTEGEGELAWLIIGRVSDKEGGPMLKAPYSAPFSQMAFHPKITAQQKRLCFKALKAHATKGAYKMEWTLAPDPYDAQLALHTALLYDSGFRCAYPHVNQWLPLCESALYLERVSRSFRKNLKRAEAEGCSFEATPIARAYGIISKNRQEKGYPLKLSCEAIMVLECAVPHAVQAFVVTYQGIDLAAALVYQVTPATAQVIYWGHLDAYQHVRPMEYLVYALQTWYYQRGIMRLDIGPATVDEEISMGLLQFKANIGCEIALKPVMVTD